MRSILIALMFLMTFGGVVSGQGLSEGSFKSQFKKVEGLLYDELYTQALPLAKELYISDSTNANVTSMLGQAYLGVGDQKKAIYYLEKAVPMVSLMYSESDPKEKKAPGVTYYFLAKAYHFDYRFEDAVANYYNYRSFIPMEDIDLYNRIKRDIEMAETASIIYENPVEIEAKNLGSNINTEYPEYSPVISADGSTLIFTSRRKGSTGGKKDIDGMFFEDIYVCRNQGGSWSAPVGIGSNINSDKHEASIGLSPDGTKLFIYKSEGSAGDIYLSELENNNWTVPKKLGEGINTKYWETHASINRRGDTIYYVSDMKGGIGGRDIYYSVLLPNGEWSLGRNLGSTINTELDEEAPFISFDGSELIFSSKGHNSMGGFDIFTSAWDGSTWSTPVNIGYPINSPKDDIFFVTTPDGKYAYYSSQMEGGYGEKDLYLINLKFKEKEVPNVTVMQGEIKVSGSPTTISDASIVVTDLSTGKMEGMYKPRPDNGRYIFILEPGKNYKVTYSCANYAPVEETVRVPKDSRYAEINKVVLIDPVEFGAPAMASKEEEPKEEVLPEEEETVTLTEPLVDNTETDAAIAEAEAALKKQEEEAAAALAAKQELERKKKEEAAALALEQEKERKEEAVRIENEKKEQEEKELAQASLVNVQANEELDSQIAEAEDCEASKNREADKVAQEKAPLSQKVSDLEHKWKSADDEARSLEADAADANSSLEESRAEVSNASPDRKALLEKKIELLKKIAALKTKKANDARAASDVVKAELDVAQANLSKVESKERQLRQEAKDCGNEVAQLEKRKTEASGLAQSEAIEAKRLEQERKDREAAEAARLEQEKKEQEDAAAALAAKKEQERKDAEAAEAARLEQERKDQEAAETAHLEQERKDKEAADAKLAAETRGSESQSFTIDQIKQDYEAQLAEKKKEIAELKVELNKKDEIIREKDAIIEQKDAAIAAAEQRAEKAEAELRIEKDNRESERTMAAASSGEDAKQIAEILREENRELKSKMSSIEDKLDALIERDASVYNEAYVDPANVDMNKDRPVMTNLEELKSGRPIVLKNIFFDYNKANIKANSRTELERLAKFLNANPSVKLEISGHTDSWGNDEYNLRLSNSRAQAVVEYLVSKGGIRSSRLIPRGYGEKRPVAANEYPDGTDNPQGRALNRRIELRLLNYKGNVKVEKIEVPSGMEPKS